MREGLEVVVEEEEVSGEAVVGVEEEAMEIGMEVGMEEEVAEGMEEVEMIVAMEEDVTEMVVVEVAGGVTQGWTVSLIYDSS